jgi:para-aminobenzoate synthetase component 1
MFLHSRNDLAHVCEAGTIKVDELFGSYPFKTLNHLISTVSGTLKDSADLKDIMSAMFPMGSMTGAPKIEVMKHIKAYEDHQRGIYSGCLGYVSPDSDFDFNVIIRTLVYHHAENTITYKVGSAITFDSEAEHEYEECLLKGHRLEDVFRA